MTEGIAAECHRPMLRILEDLLPCCTSVEGFRESRFEVIDMNIQVHWCPMTFIVARLARGTGSGSAGAFLEEADLRMAGVEHDHTRDRFRGLRAAKGAGVEANCVGEVRYVDANRY